MHKFNPTSPQSEEVYRDIINSRNRPFTHWFHQFDMMTGGLYLGQCMVIGGATSAGKSTIAIQLMMQLSELYNTLYISTETPSDDILRRAWLRFGGNYPGKIYAHEVIDESAFEAMMKEWGLPFDNMCVPSSYMIPTAGNSDLIEEYDIIILDYLKTDSADSIEGSRTMRSMVDAWRRYAEDKNKLVILFTQIRDWSTKERGNFTTYSDFWLSTSMCQPAYTVLGVHRLQSAPGMIISAVDVIKNRNIGDGEYNIGRFCIKMDTKNCIFTNVSEIVNERDCGNLVNWDGTWTGGNATYDADDKYKSPRKI